MAAATKTILQALIAQADYYLRSVSKARVDGVYLIRGTITSAVESLQQRGIDFDLKGALAFVGLTEDRIDRETVGGEPLVDYLPVDVWIIKEAASASSYDQDAYRLYDLMDAVLLNTFLASNWKGAANEAEGAQMMYASGIEQIRALRARDATLTIGNDAFPTLRVQFEVRRAQ